MTVDDRGARRGRESESVELCNRSWNVGGLVCGGVGAVGMTGESGVLVCSSEGKGKGEGDGMGWEKSKVKVEWMV